MMEHEFELEKGKSVSTYTQDSMLRSNIDNDNMEDERELQTSTLKSKTKKRSYD